MKTDALVNSFDIQQKTTLSSMSRGEEVFWLNPSLQTASEALQVSEIEKGDVNDAAELLRRFAPVLMHYFPETVQTGGIIESPLTEIKAFRKALSSLHTTIPGRLFLKRDSDLAVAGSVKARGGIYEVLKHAETLALTAGLLNSPDDDHMKLTAPSARAFFSEYKVQVGSTGNLGMSIGISSAALGFHAIVHMSADAKQWKKDLLCSRGVTVYEYEGDYGEAVKNGRARSDADPNSYFVDDERSRDLFCGYAVAGERLASQLQEAMIPVDQSHPLFVYIPCGVGGAPGGVTFGLKQVFGDNVHCFFAEPTQAPCMLLGLLTGEYGNICVQDIGLSGKTQADGLAVGRCSSLAAKTVQGLLGGEATVDDMRLNDYLRLLYQTEHLFIEPSACAAFHALRLLFTSPEGKRYLRDRILPDALANATHIVWATGGSLVPEAVRTSLLYADA